LCRTQKYRNDPIKDETQLQVKLKISDITVYYGDAKLNISGEQVQLELNRRGHSLIEQPVLDSYLSTLYNQTQLIFADSFEYRPEPEVWNVRDLVNNHTAAEFDTVEKGGTELLFEGKHLDSVAYPKLELLSHSNQSHLLEVTYCRVNNSSVITCLLPPLPHISSDPNKAYFVLHLDKVQVNSLNLQNHKSQHSIINYHYNPVFGHINLTMSTKERIIELRGNYLDLDLPYKISLIPEGIYNKSILCNVDKTISSKPYMLKCKVAIEDSYLDQIEGKRLTLKAEVGAYSEK